MGAHNFQELSRHIGHKLECVAYTYPDSSIADVAIECMDCCEVLLDYEPEEATNGNN